MPARPDRAGPMRRSAKRCGSACAPSSGCASALLRTDCRPPCCASRVYARKLDGAQEARLIALACSDPPVGKKRWTLRLLAEQMMALEIVADLSHETVRQVLGEKCAQAAPAEDVVHSAKAIGRVRLSHGGRARGLRPSSRSATPGGVPGRVEHAGDR